MSEEAIVRVAYGRTVQPKRFESLRGDISVTVDSAFFHKIDGAEQEVKSGPAELEEIATSLYDAVRITLWKKFQEEGVNPENHLDDPSFLYREVEDKQD